MLLQIYFSDGYNTDQINLFKEIFILHISMNGTFLHYIVKTYIIFQSSRTILLLYTSNVFVFTNSLCIFAKLRITIFNFSTSKVQKNFYNNILLKCKKILKVFAPFFFILVIWQFNTFLISMFLCF